MRRGDRGITVGEADLILASDPAGVVTTGMTRRRLIRGLSILLRQGTKDGGLGSGPVLQLGLQQDMRLAVDGLDRIDTVLVTSQGQVHLARRHSRHPRLDMKVQDLVQQAEGSRRRTRPVTRSYIR